MERHFIHESSRDGMLKKNLSFLLLACSSVSGRRILIGQDLSEDDSIGHARRYVGQDYQGVARFLDGSENSGDTSGKQKHDHQQRQLTCTFIFLVFHDLYEL